MKPKEVISGFEEASWESQAALTVFLAKASKAPATTLLDVFEHILCQEGAATDPRHGARVDAFRQLLLRGQPLDALFLPLVQALPRADTTVRAMLLEVLPRLNNPGGHRAVCALLEHPERAVRELGGQLLASLESASAPGILAKLMATPGFLGRREALSYFVSTDPSRAGAFIVATLKDGTDAEKLAALDHLRDPRVVGENRTAAMELLLGVFRDPSDAVVVRAIELYAHFADADAYFQNVVPGLGAVGQRVEVSGAIIQNLRRYRDPRTLDTIEKVIEVGPLALRLSALDVLDQLGDQSVLPILTEALAHPQVAVRTRATEVLLRLAQGGLDLRRTLQWLARHDQAQVRRLAMHLAAHLEDPDGQLWPALLDRLADPDWWVRERLVDALVHLGGEAVVPAILRVLHTGAPLARLYAIDVLERVGNADARIALLDLAEFDEEPSVKERAMHALAHFADDPTVLEKLAQLLDEATEPALQIACIETLRALGARARAKAIARHAAAADPEVRAAVLACLDDFDDPRCAPTVEKLLTDSQPWIRERAAALLDRWATYQRFPDDGVLHVSLDALLLSAVKHQANTVVLAGRAPPLMRTPKGPKLLGEEKLQPEQVKRMLYPALTPHQRSQLTDQHDVDTSYQLPNGQALFHLHVARQRTGFTAVFSRSERALLPLGALGLPEALQNVTQLRSGLILVAGAARQGKSTLAHALIDRMNHHTMRHIITLESQLAIVHQPIRSVITQRELGTHAARLDLALKAALREDPDVLVLDDLRSFEAIRFAVSAAETGHLVIGTVEAEDTTTALLRIIEAFPESERDYVRGTLAGNLRLAIASRLLPRADQRGVIGVGELLLHTPALGALLRAGKTKQIASLISTSAEVGMRTFAAEEARHREEGTLR